MGWSYHYVLLTEPFYAKKYLQEAEKIGFENYTEITKQEHTWEQRRRRDLKKLFETREKNLLDENEGHNRWLKITYRRPKDKTVAAYHHDHIHITIGHDLRTIAFYKFHKYTIMFYTTSWFDIENFRIIALMMLLKCGYRGEAWDVSAGSESDRASVIRYTLTDDPKNPVTHVDTTGKEYDGDYVTVLRRNSPCYAIHRRLMRGNRRRYQSPLLMVGRYFDLQIRKRKTKDGEAAFAGGEKK